MQIEKLNTNNLNALVELYLKLFPNCNYTEEQAYFTKALSTDKETCFLLKKEDNYIAFIHLNLRTDYVEGTSTSPVAYLEAIYVEPDYQKTGIGKLLVEQGRQWAKTMGCTEYASDVELTNENSIGFHKNMGFTEVNRVACFMKKIK